MKLRFVFPILLSFVLLLALAQFSDRGTAMAGVPVEGETRLSYADGIRVEPSTEVEVGEEVLFDANGYTYTTKLEDDIVEWDFGDGHSMTWDDHSRSGIAVVHFYMQSGSFTVTMTIRDYDTPSTIKAVETIPMTVTGEAALAGFELWHAPFHARTAQYIYVQVPESVRQTSTNRLRVTLTGPSYSTTLVDKADLQAEEVFLLDHAVLPQGDYVLLAELLDGSDQHLSLIREKFPKPYDGVPHVGIDENNAFRVDGELYYPVTPWLLDRGRAYNWQAGGYINTLYNEGYNTTHDLSTWQDYVQYAQDKNLMVIGEDRWSGKADNMRNSDTGIMAQYIQATKDSSAMFMWMWDDEPNMGGWSREVPPQVLAAWTKVSHMEDPQHPVLSNMYGYIYLPSYMRNKYHWWYNFLHSKNPPSGIPPVYGDKNYFIADALGIPIFSMENYTTTMMHDPDDPDRAAIDLHMQAVDLQISMNYGLLPTLAFVAPADVRLNDTYGIPTPEQVRMLAWLMVTHNVKGIHWYHYMSVTPPENYAVIAEFGDQVTDLTPVILGPQPNLAISDTANTKGHRVDTLVRQDGDTIYIFAARVTELDYLDNPAAEPENITVEFTVPGLTSAAHLSEYRDYQRSVTYHPVSTSQNTFRLTLDEPPQPGTLSLAGYRETLSNPWLYIFDDGQGQLMRQDYNSGQVVPAGSVVYATGEVSADFGLDLTVGDENIVAAYAREQGERTLPLVGGKFQDTFAREAVHIYRISLNDLELHATPDDRAIRLDWEVSTTLPATSTWIINYESPGSAYLPITGILSPTRAYTLTNLTNDVWYTVTLNAMLGTTPLLTDTVTAMPHAATAAQRVYLPLVLR